MEKTILIYLIDEIIAETQDLNEYSSENNQEACDDVIDLLNLQNNI